MSTYKELRQEFNSKSFRDKMKKEKGEICVNCGSIKFIDYHHIVPLENGGTNNLSNIVPLCVNCHLAAHDKASHNNRMEQARAEGKLGRKRKTTYEKALPILKRYFNNEIGLAEAKELLGLSPKNKSSWYEVANKYKEEYNIPKDFYNKIDLKASQEKRLKAAMKK